jgi:16S rRNA (cytidine1402-2'-O)-methyltransferase
LFTEVAESKRTVVFYESPHRILKTLETLAEVLPAEKTVVVARELTKVFEEVKSGPAGQVLDFFLAFPEKVRGEFVVMVKGE